MKTIVILSTEPWGKMLLSKMHYAIELSEQGHQVFFVNPPRKIKGKGVAVINEQINIPNLKIIDTKLIKGNLFFRYKLFFIYKRISANYIKAIQKIVNKKIDEVWSFDPNVYVDLRQFRATKAILLVYDFYKGKTVFKTARSSDAIISISQVIMDYYKDVDKPKLLLQHGLGKSFSQLANKTLITKKINTQREDKIKIGYVGNLLRAAMNFNVAKSIISNHGDKEFHIWGPYSLENNNVSPEDDGIANDLKEFISFLQNQHNVRLHGVIGQNELAENLFKMDAFLFLYSAEKDINGASNSHKIIEYLSTGKVVVSTFVSNYEDTDLLEMTDKDSEDRLPLLFDKVIGNLKFYNAEEKQNNRISFALNNTYKSQIHRIHNFIYS